MVTYSLISLLLFQVPQSLASDSTPPNFNNGQLLCESCVCGWYPLEIKQGPPPLFRRSWLMRRGGQAKTLMIVQNNLEIRSFSESLSTLKFAERVSGVELGDAQSTKVGTDVRDLMEQIASLKDEIVIKDEEIDQLQLLKR